MDYIANKSLNDEKEIHLKKLVKIYLKEMEKYI